MNLEGPLSAIELPDLGVDPSASQPQVCGTSNVPFGFKGALGSLGPLVSRKSFRKSASDFPKGSGKLSWTLPCCGPKNQGARIPRNLKRSWRATPHIWRETCNMGTVLSQVAQVERRHSFQCMHGCCWETFYIFAYCGLVGNPHPTANILTFPPLPTSTKYG